MKKFSIALITALLAFSALAPTFLGNGGGLGEIQFTRATEDLRVIREFCLNPEHKCDLSESEARALLATARPYELKFWKEKSERPFWFEGDRLLVSSQFLYLAEDMPKSFEALATLAYTALLSRDSDAPELLAQKLYARFNQSQSRRMRFGWNGKTLSVLHLKNSELSDSLFFEMPSKSHDVTEAFTGQGLCGGRKSLDRVRLGQWVDGRMQITGRVTSSCSRAEFLLEVKPLLDDNIESTLHLSLIERI